MKILVPKWSLVAIIAVTKAISSSGFAPISYSHSVATKSPKARGHIIDSGSIAYAKITTEKMLLLEAAKAMALAKAKEEASGFIQEKKEEVIIQVKEQAKQTIRQKVRAYAKKQILAFLKARAIKFALDKLQDLRVDVAINYLNVTNSSKAVLEELEDPYTNLVIGLLPGQIIKDNQEPTTNKDIELYNEDGDQKFQLGWKPTEKKQRFGDKWENKFLPSVSIEIAEDLSVERIREDAFTGTPGPQSDLLFDVMRSSLVYPLDDQIVKFSNSSQVKTLVEDVKLHYGKDASGEEGASPKATHDWGDPTTNEHFSRFFFHGIGASLLEKQMGPSTQPDLGPIEIDLSFMAGLEVRKGFRPYGAKIYFDDKQKVQAIYDSHKETLVRPGDQAWQSTMFLAKSSAFTLCVARENLLNSHLTVSNYLALSSIKNLPPNHPIRRLTNIFTYNANRVNGVSIETLIPDRSMLHRCSAFTYESLTKVFKSGFADSNAFEPFTKRNMRPELLKLSDDDKLPYHSEGCEYYVIVENFVRDWLERSGDAANDEYAQAFYNDIREKTIGSNYVLPGFETQDAMVDLLTQSIFTVTAYHEIIGTVIDYVEDPWTLSTRVVDEEEGAISADVQAYLIFLVVTASTARKMPMLMKPYGNYFGKDGAPRWERKEWGSFMRDLRRQSRRVKGRNTGFRKREPEFKFFNPKQFECSISV